MMVKFTMCKYTQFCTHSAKKHPNFATYLLQNDKVTRHDAMKYNIKM